MSTLTPDRFIIREESGREVGRETRLGVARKVALQLARTHGGEFAVYDSLGGACMGRYKARHERRADDTPPEAMRRRRP